MIKLGSYVRDKLTGFEGYVDNRATFLFGCDRYYVITKSVDNKPSEGIMIDEPQLEVLEDSSFVVSLPKQLIDLGSVVYDPVYKITGVASARAVYLNGCSRISIEYLDKDGDPSNIWIDEPRLEFVKNLLGKNKKVFPEKKIEKSRLTGGPVNYDSRR